MRKKKNNPQNQGKTDLKPKDILQRDKKCVCGGKSTKFYYSQSSANHTSILHAAHTVTSVSREDDFFTELTLPFSLS